MAEPIKSVLLVDFDSIHRSLTAGGGEAAARFISRIPGWVGALESGRLIGPEHRTFVLKRCYADPRTLGDARVGFAGAGFEVVDCVPSTAGRGVDLTIAMDSVEYLHDADDVDEFIFLSAEPTLAPLLSRLKGRQRGTAIYADTGTTPAYRVLADAVLDVTALAEFLLTHDAPEAASAGGIDRTDIEAFARKIHAATSIPLFSPRTFAELFRLLTEEIVANGYHFQTTAKNVAERLAESGRSVTRRQVVFIVKGLALKGHVFSTGDTPRKLAEVFREQAKYLIENAGLKLDEAQEKILGAWLVDRVPVGITRAAAIPVRTPAAATMNGARPAAESAPAPAPAPPSTKSTPPSVSRTEPPRPGTSRPAEKPVERPAPAERPLATAMPSPAQPERQQAPARPEPRTAGSMISPDDARAAIAAKIAQSVRPKPAPRPGPKAALPAPAPLAINVPPSPAKDERPAEEPESIETSILAAIAQAVDVLVEDDEQEPEQPKKAIAPARRRPAPVPARTAETRPAAERPAPEPRARPKPEPRGEDGGEDIGDEIQRIIATYNRNRKDEPPPEANN